MKVGGSSLSLLETCVVENLRDLHSVDFFGFAREHGAFLVGQPAFVCQMLSGSWVAVEFGGLQEIWWQLLLPGAVGDDRRVGNVWLCEVHLMDEKKVNYSLPIVLEIFTYSGLN